MAGKQCPFEITHKKYEIAKNPLTEILSPSYGQFSLRRYFDLSKMLPERGWVLSGRRLRYAVAGSTRKMLSLGRKTGGLTPATQPRTAALPGSRKESRDRVANLPGEDSGA